MQDEVDKKGHCFAKTLKQSPPRLSFSSDLCRAALRIHANTAVLCSDSSTVLQMVRLFLFRLGSLLGLFALLVWEAFYRPNGDNFAGKHDRKTKNNLQILCLYVHSLASKQFNHVNCTFLQEIISSATMHTVSRKIFGRYVSVYLIMYQIKSLLVNSFVFSSREIKAATYL